jgi:hypothetical protein
MRRRAPHTGRLSSRRAARPSTPSASTPGAANSIASGRPSSLRQIAATRVRQIEIHAIDKLRRARGHARRGAVECREPATRLSPPSAGECGRIQPRYPMRSSRRSQAHCGATSTILSLSRTRLSLHHREDESSLLIDLIAHGSPEQQRRAPHPGDIRAVLLTPVSARELPRIEG